MKNIFPSNFKNVIFESLFIALLVFFLQNYLLKLWAPSTAAETLKRENFIESKKETYLEAIKISTRELAGYIYKISSVDTGAFKRNIGMNIPTEFEINLCLSKLYIYSNDKILIESFKNIYRKGYNPIQQQITMMQRISKDIGNDSKIIENYEYITISRDTSSLIQ